MQTSEMRTLVLDAPGLAGGSGMFWKPSFLVRTETPQALGCSLVALNQRLPCSVHCTERGTPRKHRGPSREVMQLPTGDVPEEAGFSQQLDQF